MKDPRITKLASILVDYSTKVKKGDFVILDFSGTAPLPLVKELYKLCLKRGAKWVEYNFASEELGRAFLDTATPEQLSYFPRHRMDLIKKADVYIGISGSENSMTYAEAEQARIIKRERILRPILEQRLNHTRWVITRYPTPALAQDARLSLEEFEDFYFSACNIDWPSFSRKITRLWRLMNKTDRVHIKASDTDLRFSIKGIGAIKSEGLRNMPDGEVFTAPVRDSVEGYITYNTPSIYQGREFNGIRLEFKKGKIIKASASSGDNKALEKIFDTDKGARYIGEFALGLNQKITRPMRNILFDEKIAGSIHFTPGMAYKNCDNKNRSAIHWDLVKILKGDGEIYFDGRLIQKNGRFVRT